MIKLPRRPWDLGPEVAAGDRVRLRLHLETRRYRKPVTVIEGLEDAHGPHEILRRLKQGLATGGTWKEGRIELQGDHRARLREILRGLGFDPSDA